MSRRDRIAALVAAQMPAQVPLPWPMPPGHKPLTAIPKDMQDNIERPAVSEGYDANAIHGEDVMRNYFYPQDYQPWEDI